MCKSTANVFYNYSALLWRIRAAGLTQESLAEKIGVNPSTLNLKLNNKGVFTQKEMHAIIKVLGESVESIALYFFCDNTLENESFSKSIPFVNPL